MFVKHIRERSDTACPSYCLSALSIINVLHDELYVWKAFRKSKAFIFTAYTSLACVHYSQAFLRFHERSGGIKHAKLLLFGDESTYTHYERGTEKGTFSLWTCGDGPRK